MAARRTVRVVDPGERAPAKAKPPTLAEAIEAGDYVGILKAQRREIIAALPTARGTGVATLHRQLTAISKEIAELDQQAAGEGSVVATTNDATFDESAI
jgi:hypothetical protein